MTGKGKPKRRRAKPARTKLETARAAARKSARNEASKRRERERRLAEALEQQAATAEILRVIGTSPADTQPVFDGIARSGVRVCGAKSCTLFVVDGNMLRVAATYGVPPERVERFRTQYPMPLSAKNHVTQVLHERRIFHLADIEHNPATTPEHIENARLGGYRTRLMVPMLRGDRALGLIAVTHQAPTPFSDQQIALLQTFADQAVIAIENVRLFSELEGRNRDLTATSEILRMISSSPTDVQPVFDTIIRCAVQLSGALMGGIYPFDGKLMHLAGLYGTGSDAVPLHARDFPRPPDRGFVAGRAILDRRATQMPDVLEDPEFQGKEFAHAAGWRSSLSVPMLRDGQPIGAISVARAEPGLVPETIVALLRTFADQAVIAIENVRLFNETKEALEQQTATSEILRVISSSPTDVQPVFDVIVERAVRLCGARFGRVYRYDSDVIHMVAGYGLGAVGLGEVQRVFPRPASDDTIVGRAILTRQPVLIRDIEREEGVPALSRRMIQALETRSQATIPMLRAGDPIGAMTLGWAEPEAFDEQQIALLKTFADQAVIAIENVRLFNELEGRNRDLTATSEILRVISSSPTDVQPVFNAMVESAVRLCDARFGAVFRFDRGLIHLAAHHNFSETQFALLQAKYPMKPNRGHISGRAILTGAAVQISDIIADEEYRSAEAKEAGFRSLLGVPMLRGGRAIGAIVIYRTEPGQFADNQIELLKTFADQAVIAVENVRLFKELQSRTTELTRSVDQLTALGEISQAVSSTLDVETVLQTIVSRASQLAGADGCAIYEYDDATEAFHIRAAHSLDPALVEKLRASPLRKGEGAMGRAAEAREPIQVADIAVPGAYQSHIRDTLVGAGYRALLSVPLLREGKVIGSLSLNRHVPGEFPPEVIEVLKTFATQSALAIQNARLFREIADKSAQLETASRHKSEFLANMSHELRTPLNAIIGFSEVLVDRMFGELNEKQEEYLKDIYSSGQHLLSLINDILDLSKIEAGRMELEAADFDLPSAIDNALILVRERASRRGITLGHSVDERLGQIRGDERKVKQVLLNLLSNALKFTPEGGRIDVSAVVNDGVAEIAVADTGVGIAPEDQEAVFEEFRQVGTADKKVEGTGLGLALSRKFIELHGGRIWVQSTVGVGSTFTFTLPLPR